MPFLTPTYKEHESYLKDLDAIIVELECALFLVGEDQRIPYSQPRIAIARIHQRVENHSENLRSAYVVFPHPSSQEQVYQLCMNRKNIMPFAWPDEWPSNVEFNDYTKQEFMERLVSQFGESVTSRLTARYRLNSR